MLTIKKYIISYSYSHIHSSAGTRVRLLNSKYLKNNNWNIVTSRLSTISEDNVIVIPSLVDKLFKPISYKNTESKRTLKKIFNNLLWPDRGIFWSIKVIIYFVGKLLFEKEKIRIVGVGYPFSSILCSAIIKSFFKNKVHFTAHFIDGFYLTSKDSSNILRRKINYLTEKFVLKNSDHAIVCEDKIKEFKKCFNQFVNKTTFVPTMIGIDTDLRSFNSPYNNNKHDYHFFGGSLYRKIRNPEKVIEIYKHLQNTIFTIAGNLNDCSSMVKSSGHLEYVGNLSQENLINYIQHSNILINIDNQTSIEQSPGKIVEYMAFQKPIINYYKNSSLSKSILEKYDLCKASLSIDIEEPIDTNLEKINNFIKSTQNLNGRLYSTPDTLELTYNLYNRDTN
ncbi:hypothetical protein [Halobacteriovorax sp. RT-2-1]|uniref:hypothetical protein n=1 Tax=Halobacteriovorax sp. RT-2-1 TaxID=3391164 RepID=UPI00399A2EEE